MEIITILLFCTELIICIASGIPVLYALCAGLVIFIFYALKRGFSLKDIFYMCSEGVWTARRVITAMLLIGILTAMWRAAGTIPVIVCYTGALVTPALFLPAAFLLNCTLSVITGTSFGTAATLGVICAATGVAMGINPMLTGGAVLSGIFFGDRCSPVSTSALLIAEITQSDIYDNIKLMIKTAAVPFALSCILYTVTGFAFPNQPASINLTELFSGAFKLHCTALIPALLIFLLAIFRVPVRSAMSLSILSAIPVCIFLQDTEPYELLRYAFSGFRTETPELAPLINGGGMLSMVKVSFIVCISSAYSGIFQKTGMLNGVKGYMKNASEKITPFGAAALTALVTAMVTCNQTLSIMLTKQLCFETEEDKTEFAVYLEDSAVVIPALVPWSIAGAVPLSTINAPVSGILFAYFLWLLPLCSFIRGAVKKRHRSGKNITG